MQRFAGAAAVTRSFLPVSRVLPVVRPLRFRVLTLQSPSAGASGCGFPGAFASPALTPGCYGCTAPPGVAENVITEVFMQYSNQQRARVINIEESDRLSFLPYLFGDDFMLAELQVCALARKMITGYEGGFWHFIRLPDGGGYLMPDCGPVHLVNSENWFDRTVSADAAGIILTSLAINRRLWTHHECGNAALTHLFQTRDAQLWSHIEFHPECNAIYAALD
ncbi:DUF1472 domain-containing protein [Salmonella enterica subsp. arizonae]|nr:DUF1472 domain-containing protein [Salmonella enterica subsp. arizonae]